MKKVLLFFGWILLFASTANAQVPQGIPYQAVARNGQSQPLASTNVKVRFSILDSTATGAAVYVESHSTTTSALGLFSANVGMGTASIGTFSSINWGQNFKFLKVELDTTATGNSYIDLGTQQMMSVPYALYAGSTDSWNVNADSVFSRKWVSIWPNNLNAQAPLYVGDGPNGDASVRLRNGFGTSKVLHIIEQQASSGHYGIFVGAHDYSDAVFVTKNDKVGIKTINPQRPLHVNDVMRLEPRSTPPSLPGKGDIYFDSTFNKLRVYDGNIWQNCW